MVTYRRNNRKPVEPEHPVIDINKVANIFNISYGSKKAYEETLKKESDLTNYRGRPRYPIGKAYSILNFDKVVIPAGDDGVHLKIDVLRNHLGRNESASYGIIIGDIRRGGWIPAYALTGELVLKLEFKSRPKGTATMRIPFTVESEHGVSAQYRKEALEKITASWKDNPDYVREFKFVPAEGKRIYRH